METRYTGSSKCHKFALLIIALAVVLAALLPASTHANTLYLPAITNGRDWFTQADFEGALVQAGYNPAQVLLYTWCELDDSADPPQVIHYSACYLELTPDDDTDDYRVMFWWHSKLGRMWWAVQS